MTDSHTRTFPAMGSAAHVIVVGGSRRLVDHAVDRIAGLEAKWSRFRADSEVSWHNATLADATPTSIEPRVRVSLDTQLLFERAAEGYRITGGRFDPYRLDAVTGSGYRTSFGSIGLTGARPSAPQRGFDPGGIGKGLAADLVSGEIMEAGAEGVLVNIGGDLRVRGVSPDGDWRIEIEDPRTADRPSTSHRPTTVVLSDGAVATSSQVKRRWTDEDGNVRHHLIDPRTSTTSRSPVLSATVVAAEAWQAEVLSKVAFLDAFGDGALSSDAGLELIETVGAAALVVTDDLVATTSRWKAFVRTENQQGALR